ncbi:hypothetical protein THTE_1358 [Thermogutta terrifontis]|uniref:Uncharacterized protein n=1 Tax=Thermogutta terrifontis TaxID=1331910 RepID=A0A286RDC0_9BACT|nr:hypothetical protein THTE_1358 [Thermogutta terrifontis]
MIFLLEVLLTVAPDQKSLPKSTDLLATRRDQFRILKRRK